MRILVGAFACVPGGGSEDGAGWTFARGAALRHDVWLVTQSSNSEAIENARQREPGLRLHPVYVEIPSLLWMMTTNRVTLQCYYVLWQFRVARVARRLHAELGFDVAHHLTLATDFLPMGVARLRDVAVVLGPIGGFGYVPLGLRRWLGWRGALARVVRDPVIAAMRIVFVERWARRAAVVVAENREVATRFRRAGRVLVEPNAAFALDELRGAGPAPPREERLALFAGRVVMWKGILLAIAALAQPEAADWRLEVIGPGSEADLARARRLAVRLGVADRVVFVGWLPRVDTLAAMRRAHCLLFPSLLDSGAWVVSEAVAFGTPVVGLDWLGAGVRARGAGYLVPPDRHAPRALARALAVVPLGTEPSDRSDIERLPAFLDGIYKEAVARGQLHHLGEHRMRPVGAERRRVTMLPLGPDSLPAGADGGASPQEGDQRELGA